VTQPTATPTEPANNLRPNDDASLQGWGRRQLPAIAPAIHEVAAQHAKADDVSKQTTAAVERIARMATDRTVPADPKVAAEADAIAKALRQLDTESEAINARRRSLAAQAEGLPAMYRRQHDGDEARLDGVRAPLSVERRADVSVASQDT
jgi:hypothetical protein